MPPQRSPFVGLALRRAFYPQAPALSADSVYRRGELSVPLRPAAVSCRSAAENQTQRSLFPFFRVFGFSVSPRRISLFEAYDPDPPVGAGCCFFYVLVRRREVVPAAFSLFRKCGFWARDRRSSLFRPGGDGPAGADPAALALSCFEAPRRTAHGRRAVLAGWSVWAQNHSFFKRASPFFDRELASSQRKGSACVWYVSGILPRCRERRFCSRVPRLRPLCLGLLGIGSAYSGCLSRSRVS